MPPAKTAVSPYTPNRTPLPPIGEHTLVRPLGDSPFDVRDAVDERALSVWLLLYHLDREGGAPLTVMEIATRTRMSRGVTVLMVTELLRRHRARVSRQRSSVFDPRDEVRDAWGHSSHCDATLRSSKVLVLGTPEHAGAEFIGACSAITPITHVETLYSRSAPESAGTGPTVGGVPRNSPVSVQLSMGRVPLATTNLHLLGLPDVGVFDALWPSVVRDACGALVVTGPDDVAQASTALELLSEHALPVQVVLDHVRGGPAPESVADQLGVAEGQVTLCDVRSVPATRAALGDVINQRTARRV
jgi:signal recognition particle receptor subunit beta